MGERGRALAALAGVVALGLLSRLAPVGAPLWDKVLGDALYAAAVYLGFQFFVPHWAPAALAAISLATCGAIEAFQATGIPAQYAAVAPVRWLLGTRFAVEDLVYYAIGVLMTAGLDERCRELRQTP